MKIMEIEAVAETQISHLFIVFLTSSQDKEIKLGECLPSHMIRETLVLSVTGIQQQHDVEVSPILHECCLWIGVTYPTTVI